MKNFYTNKIKKAVFPAAGYGTRFLPVTKSYPKEMLPIIDKPLIQFAVEEAIEAGIKELIFITNFTKKAIEGYFVSNPLLEQHLINTGKTDLANTIRNIIPNNVSCVFVRQDEQLGLGHAIWCVKDIIGNEPFAVLLPDDLIFSNTNCLKELSKQFQKFGSSILATEKVNWQYVNDYGILKLQETGYKNLFKINNIIEKPSLSSAPSRSAIVGRYIFTPNIFNFLDKLNTSSKKELQLTDAITELLKIENVYAYKYTGKRFDCGKKEQYLQAILEFARCSPIYNEQIKKFVYDYLELN